MVLILVLGGKIYWYFIAIFDLLNFLNVYSKNEKAENFLFRFLFLIFCGHQPSFFFLEGKFRVSAVPELVNMGGNFGVWV